MVTSTLPRSSALVHVRAPRVERGGLLERERTQRLHRLHDPVQWQAAVLALMLTPGSRREQALWFDEARALPDAQRLLADVQALSHGERLPWFETIARQLAPGPVAQRHAVIEAARRLIAADGMLTQADQLRWVALRHLLAGSAVAPPSAGVTELDTIGAPEAMQICHFSAFLSHLVPAPELTLDVSGGDSTAQLWFDGVAARLGDQVEPPLRDGHDIDLTLRALRALQSLPWLLRPVLVRTWFDVARELTDGPVLHEVAADALRLACVLLDSPVPPELGRQYIEVELRR